MWVVDKVNIGKEEVKDLSLGWIVRNYDYEVLAVCPSAVSARLVANLMNGVPTIMPVEIKPVLKDIEE